MQKLKRQKLIAASTFVIAIVATLSTAYLNKKEVRPEGPKTYAKFEFFHDSRSPASSKKGAPRSSAVLYKLKENPSPEEQERLAQALVRLDLKAERKHFDGKIHVGKAQARIDSEEDLAKELLDTGAVEFAEPDALVELAYVPNDPSVSQQWHHTRINSFGAWDTTMGTGTVIVASCDTGVESTHPELAKNLILPGYNSEDGTTNSEPIHPHGTMTAGVLAAIADNATGIAGVSPKVKILPIRISNFSDGAAYYSSMAACIEYAADHGAKVVNLSYGGSESATIDSAAQYLRARGGILMMAAGNSGLDLSANPDYASFVIVGATDANDARPWWGNYGTPIDLVAPGDNIFTTNVGQSYAWVSGTSFSAPIVSGVAALLFSLKPSFTPDQIEMLLYSTTVPLGSGRNDPTFGAGRVDAKAAVAAAKALLATPTPTPTATPKPTPTPTPTPKPTATPKKGRK